MPAQAPRPRLLFLSKGEAAASTRYRALAYFDLLRDAGYDPVHLGVRGGAAHQLALLREARRAHATIVLRRTFAAPFRALLRRAARRLIFDLDDAIYRSPAGPSPARQRGFAAMCHHADAVLAGNATLADAARQHTDPGRVHTLPTVIDLARYTPADPATLDPRRLVWIGSSSTRPYLEAILPKLEAAARAVPGLSLRIIADFGLRSDVLSIEHMPWSSEHEARLLAECGVGLAPLPDEPWTRGKCGFKLVQYMGAGLAAVCDPVGANGQIVVDGGTGLHVNAERGWADAVHALCADPARAASMGAAGRERAASHYCLTATGRAYIDLLEALG